VGIKGFLTNAEKDLDPNPDQYLVLMDPYPDPGWPKTYGSYGSRSGSKSRSATLIRTLLKGFLGFSLGVR
jgi:hypothetical protein